jgi:hypothetical protein
VKSVLSVNLTDLRKILRNSHVAQITAGSWRLHGSHLYGKPDRIRIVIVFRTGLQPPILLVALLGLKKAVYKSAEQPLR